MPPCLDAHIAWLRQRGLSSASIYSRQRALIRLREHVGVDLFTATPQQLADWQAWIAGRIGPDAQFAYVSHVRNFYRWAVRNGLAPADPSENLPYPKLGRRLPRPIAEDPLMHAVQCAPTRIRPWLVLAGWAGLRAKEIALLRREHVLDAAVYPVLLIARGATKGRNERIVPMCDFVLAELRPILPGSGWVFPRYDGMRGPNTPNLVSQMSNEHLHSCGIPETLHQLRHRFGTGAYGISHDIRVVQELLGHASVNTTAGYAAFNNSDARAAVQALPVPRRLRQVREGGA